MNFIDIELFLVDNIHIVVDNNVVVVVVAVAFEHIDNFAVVAVLEFWLDKLYIHNCRKNKVEHSDFCRVKVIH